MTQQKENNGQKHLIKWDENQNELNLKNGSIQITFTRNVWINDKI